MPEGGKAAAVDTIEWFPFCKNTGTYTHTHTGIYAHTRYNRENICSSPAACVQAMLLVGCVWRETDCIWVHECVCLSVWKRAMYNKQQHHWLYNKVPVAIAGRHTHTHTHTLQVLALISFTHGRQHQECYPRLLWGWIQMPSDWKEEEGRNGITVSVLQKPCMCISQPLVIWGFSDTPTTFCILCSC